MSASPFSEKLDRIQTTEHTLSMGKSNIHYWEYGDPSQPVDLVLIHGFRGDHHGLEPIVAELGPHIHAIIPDLPGFGSSDPLYPHADIDSFSRWLTEFWSELKVSSNTVILGHSFGSIIVSAALAAGFPADRAILINPIAANALSGPRALLTKLAVFYYALAARLPSRLGYALLKNKTIVRVMSNTMAKTEDKYLRKWIHQQHDLYFSVFASRNAVLEAFTTSVSHDVSEFAPHIPQEVLLIAAEKDDITAVDRQHHLASILSRSQLEVIPDVGHLVHYEAPSHAATLISQFLGSAR